MRIAFCLYKFFHYGGLARDFLNIANICVQRGHSVTVYVMECHDDLPEEFEVIHVPVERGRNHLRTKQFIEQVQKNLAQRSFDLVVGFNKMPGLDVYYAADPCYQEKAVGWTRFFYRLGGRYKYYSYCEKAVFSKRSNTVALMISKMQMALFTKHYQTPEQRMVLLPPGISRDRIAPDNAEDFRRKFRDAQGVAEDEFVLLMIGTAFKTKGLDRTLKAMALLPEALLAKVKLFVVGEDALEPFKKMTAKLNLGKHVTFFGGRDDVPDFLLGADLLLQPSYRENTGTAIIEAIVSDLPVLASDVCGYAFHIEQAQAGKVIPSPFKIKKFAELIEEMLTSPERAQWIKNAHHYARTEDLYSMPEKAVDIMQQIAKRKALAQVK